MKQQGERYINLEIRLLKEQLIIEVTNSVKESVEIEKLGTVTSKMDKENHGFGIENKKHGREKSWGNNL